MNNLKHLFFLTKIEGLGSVRIKRLLDKFSSAENIFNSSVKQLREVENISEKTAALILSSYKLFKDFDEEFDSLILNAGKLNIRIIAYNDADYPELLSKIYDPPVLLYIRGNYSPEKLDNCIGIVGTRRPSDYGKHITEVFASELSALGLSVISGFARGVDTIAHKSALKSTSGMGVTAAVFGCGVDVIYPPENKNLYEEMIEKGLLISEYELSAKPDAANFPKRNRIISGLSLGTIVIESDVDGGALITARTALDQSREVFAVPGYVTSASSRGTNALIKNSQAKLVENTEDVLVEITSKLKNLNINAGKQNTEQLELNLELNGSEKLVYNTFLKQTEPLHIDSISELSGLNISDSLVTLLNLEFKGCIDQLPGKRFKIKQYIKVN